MIRPCSSILLKSALSYARYKWDVSLIQQQSVFHLSRSLCILIYFSRESVTERSYFTVCDFAKYSWKLLNNGDMYSSEITGSARTSPAANHYKTDGYIAQLTRYCFAFSLRRPIHHCSTICRRLSFFLLLGYTTNYPGIAHDSTSPALGTSVPQSPWRTAFPRSSCRPRACCEYTACLF